ncbi:hypothetical protein V565_240690, partial [Rhizoctonia solani 123E]
MVDIDTSGDRATHAYVLYAKSSLSLGGTEAPGALATAIGTAYALEQIDETCKVSSDTGQPSSLVGNDQGNYDPEYVHNLMIPILDTISTHAVGTAEMPGNYPVSEHAKRKARTTPPPVTATTGSPNSEVEGMEGGESGSSSETPSPMQ